MREGWNETSTSSGTKSDEPGGAYGDGTTGDEDRPDTRAADCAKPAGAHSDETTGDKTHGA